MTVEDLLAREAIRQTMANYHMAGDRLRVDDFVAVFIDDGILESDGGPEADAFRYVGRDAMREWMSGWTRNPAANEPRTHQASFVRHHLATTQIELTGPDTAKARSYWTAYTDIGPDHGGTYLDAFSKVGELWLIAHRRVRREWRSPDSLFTKAAPGARG